MLPKIRRKIHYEEIPHDPASSFTLREFRWARFPFNWHYHPELELTLIEKGTGLRFVGDSVEEFASGDLCLLGSNTPHCWASHPNASGGVRSLVIQFLPDFLGETFFRAPEMRTISRLMQTARQGLALCGSLRQDAARRIAAISKQPEGSPNRLTELLGLLAYIAGPHDCRQLASSEYEPLSGERSGKKLAQVLKFIHTNLGPELKQWQAAESIGASPQAFSRFFARAMGKSYVAYVNELKIHKACRLLIETDANITEVAFDAGFNNLSNFNKQFRRSKGTPPRIWRRKSKGGPSATLGLRTAAHAAVAQKQAESCGN